MIIVGEVSIHQWSILDCSAFSIFHVTVLDVHHLQKYFLYTVHFWFLKLIEHRSLWKSDVFIWKFNHVLIYL